MHPTPPSLTRRRAAFSLAGWLFLATATSTIFATLTILWLAWYVQPSFSVLAWVYWGLPLTLVCLLHWKGNRASRFIRAGVSAVLVLTMVSLAVAGLSPLALVPLLGLWLLSLFASWRTSSAGPPWLLAGAFGCIAGTGGALVAGYQPGFQAQFLRLVGLLLPSAVVIGLASVVLFRVAPQLWRRLPLARLEPALSAPDQGISRRHLLLATGGLAGLVATGAGFIWLTRRWIAPWLPLVAFHAGALSLSWSPDGRFLVSASTLDVSVWDTTDGKVVNTFPIPFQIAPERVISGEVRGVAWSPDGRRIAATFDEGLLIWDATTRRLLAAAADPVSAQAAIPQYQFVWPTLVWSPDSTRLAAINTPSVSIFDATTGAVLMALQTPEAQDGFLNANDLAWSPNGTYLALATDAGTQVWDIRQGERLATLHAPTGARWASAVAWSPDSRRLASAGDNVTIWSWDGHTAQVLLTYAGYQPGWMIAPIAWSPDGTRVASPSLDSVQVWNAATGQTLFQYQGHPRNVPIALVAWSPDGSRIASGGEDGMVHIWQPD